MEAILSKEERKAVSAKLAEPAARINKMTPKERTTCDESWLYLSDYYNAIDSAVQGTGAEGEVIYNYKRQVVVNMHPDGVDIAIISKDVKLSEDEVDKTIQSIP